METLLYVYLTLDLLLALFIAFCLGFIFQYLFKIEIFGEDDDEYENTK